MFDGPSCFYRVYFSYNDEVWKVDFIRPVRTFVFCNRISKLANVASSGCVGGVGDEVAAKQLMVFTLPLFCWPVLVNLKSSTGA